MNNFFKYVFPVGIFAAIGYILCQFQVYPPLQVLLYLVEAGIIAYVVMRI